MILKLLEALWTYAQGPVPRAQGARSLLLLAAAVSLLVVYEANLAVSLAVAPIVTSTDFDFWKFDFLTLQGSFSVGVASRLANFF